MTAPQNRSVDGADPVQIHTSLQDLCAKTSARSFLGTFRVRRQTYQSRLGLGRFGPVQACVSRVVIWESPKRYGVEQVDHPCRRKTGYATGISTNAAACRTTPKVTPLCAHAMLAAGCVSDYGIPEEMDRFAPFGSHE